MFWGGMTSSAVASGMQSLLSNCMLANAKLVGREELSKSISKGDDFVLFVVWKLSGVTALHVLLLPSGVCDDASFRIRFRLIVVAVSTIESCDPFACTFVACP